MDGRDEASPQQRLDRHQTRPLLLEVCLDEVFQQFVEEMLVIQTDQPVLEDS
jgi:hypothetical protein